MAHASTTKLACARPTRTRLLIFTSPPAHTTETSRHRNKAWQSCTTRTRAGPSPRSGGVRALAAPVLPCTGAQKPIVSCRSPAAQLLQPAAPAAAYRCWGERGLALPCLEAQWREPTIRCSWKHACRSHSRRRHRHASNAPAAAGLGGGGDRRAAGRRGLRARGSSHARGARLCYHAAAGSHARPDPSRTHAHLPLIPQRPCPPCPSPRQLPPLPDWAQQRPTITGNWLGSRRYNLRLVERANATNRLYDVVFYGDSLVALIP